MPRHAVVRLLLPLTLLSLAACTLQPPASDNGAATTEAIPTEQTPAEAASEPAAASANPAVIALLDTADSDAGAGRLPTAIASVERALRIEPKNPVLWQKLAQLKLEKGDYRQAENFAARSNSWAGANKALQARNWRIISEARSLRGDNKGARAALQRAQMLEQ